MPLISFDTTCFLMFSGVIKRDQPYAFHLFLNLLISSWRLMFSCLTSANTKWFSSFTSKIASVLALLYLFSLVSFAISFSLTSEFPTSFACYKRQACTLTYVPPYCIKICFLFRNLKLPLGTSMILFFLFWIKLYHQVEKWVLFCSKF